MVAERKPLGIKKHKQIRKPGAKRPKNLYRVSCSCCGKELWRPRYWVKKQTQFFCNHPCFGQWKAQNWVGSNNPNFTPQSNARAAGQFYRNRALAKARDGGKCVRCGSSHRIQVHHIIPWSADQEDPHRLGNLETLCHSCHILHHAKDQSRRKAQSESIKASWTNSAVKERHRKGMKAHWADPAKKEIHTKAIQSAARERRRA
jgi:hypothetical protein